MASRRPAGVAVAALLGLLAFGCDATRPSGPPTASQVAVSANACTDLIKAVDLARPETIDAVDPCRFTDAGADAARRVLQSNPAGGARWAALWVYAASDADPAPLAPYLTSDDPTVRAMAAAATVRFGDRAGFAVLGQSLTESRQLEGTRPPSTIAAFALGTLNAVVLGDDVPTAADAWPSWLGAHAAGLVFDAAAGTWSQP